MANEFNEQELESKSPAEIKALALAAEAKENAEAAKTAAAADLDNSHEHADDQEEDEDPVTKHLFRKEINNGDGSGVDVYEAETLEELVDKIADGKANANKKIRELSSKVREQPVEKTYTADEEFIYSQELMSKPTAAFKKLFKEVTGYDIQDFKTKIERVDAFEASQRASAVQTAWMAQHPEYLPNNDNARKMGKQLELNGEKEFTAEGLEKAYLELNKSGLLELKSEGADADTKLTTDTKQRTVASQQEATQQRSRRSSTLPNRNTRTVPVKTEYTEDELLAMPREKLRALANQALAGNS